MMNVSETANSYWRRFPAAPTEVHISVGLFVLITTTVSVTANALVILVYTWKRRLNYSFRPYLLTMAVSDSVGPASSSWMFVVSSFEQHWLYGQTGCSAYGFVQGTSALISITTIAAISAQRCFAVRFPAQARVLFEKTSYHLKVVLFVHFYATMAAGPPLVGWGRYSTDGLLTSCCFEFVDRSTPIRLYILYLYALGFVAPLTVIALAWFVLRRHYRKSSLRELSRQRSQLVVRRSQRELKVTRMMTVITSGFLIAWTPYAVIALIGQFGPTYWTIHPYTVTAASLLAKTSTIYNPLIYAYSDAEFRASVMKLCTAAVGYGGGRKRDDAAASLLLSARKTTSQALSTSSRITAM